MYLEFKAVVRCLKHFLPQIKNKVVLIVSDNATTVAYLRSHGGVRVWALNILSFHLSLWAKKHGITLQARHIPGSLNVLADKLSRKGQIQQTEWSLHPQVFLLMVQRMWTPLVDLFATSENHKLPIYVSPIPDEKALAVDAMSIDWTGMNAYAYPPTKLLPAVLSKIENQPCCVLLIAPVWLAQSWFWDLIRLSIDRPMRLPQHPRLLRQPGSQVFDHNLAMRNLHAWTLSANPLQLQGSPTKWWQEFMPHREHPPARFTAVNSDLSNLGQEVMGWMNAGSL